MDPNRTKPLTAVIYLCAAVAILGVFAALAGALSDFQSVAPSNLFFRSLLLFAPLLIFASAYARLILDPSIGKKQRVLAAVINCCAAVLSCMWFLRISEVQLYDNSLIFDLIMGVVVPLSFLVVSIAVFRKYPLSHTLGMLTALVVWPYLVFVVLGSHIRGYDDPLSTLLLYSCFISPLIFVFASAATLIAPRGGYIMGLVGGLAGLSWLIRTEFLYFKRAGNSWIPLNLADKESDGFVLVAELRIIAVGLIICSVMRLMPVRWTWRKSPLSAHTWPAFALAFVALMVWFGRSVTPYRLPGIVHGVPSELTVLHVEKRGLQFHETVVNTRRDRVFEISQNNRRLFQYRFKVSGFQGVMPSVVQQHEMALVQSLKLRKPSTAPPKALRTWNADGWYVLSEQGDVLAFTSEYGTVPPREVVDLFHELEGLPPQWTREGDLKDVCLGFCYDPLAGLGFRYLNERCSVDKNGTRCR